LVLQRAEKARIAAPRLLPLDPTACRSRWASAPPAVLVRFVAASRTISPRSRSRAARSESHLACRIANGRSRRANVRFAGCERIEKRPRKAFFRAATGVFLTRRPRSERFLAKQDFAKARITLASPRRVELLPYSAGAFEVARAVP
jgi:hypothetical protein